MFRKLLISKHNSSPTISFHNGNQEFSYSTTIESFEFIKKYLENQSDKPFITRLELCNLLEGKLKELATNQDVQLYLISIMPTLINIAFHQNPYSMIFQQDVLTDLSRSDDLQQAVFSITQKRYLNSINHIINYLLRYKDTNEPLSFMEVYLVYNVMNSILFNTSEQIQTV